MQNRKEKLFEKIVKKDYENELEEVLEERKFEENVKNMLLNILYKIENAYNDYRKVKRNVETKEEYIRDYIKAIKDGCTDIQLNNFDEGKKNKSKGKPFVIEDKKIISYPIEIELLYAIFLANINENIINEKYFLIDKALSKAINTGYCIDKVEPLRDFNGWSWATLTDEVESIEYNLIFQNLISVIDRQFLKEWINNKDYEVDYLQLFEQKLDSLYGEKLTKKFMENLKNVSILMYLNEDENKNKEMIKLKKSLNKELEELKDTKKLILYVSKNKKKINTKIEEVDKILNNRLLLEEEYKKRNEKLKLKDKMFSTRMLIQELQEERNNLLNEFEQYNSLLNPNNYVIRKKEIEEKLKVLFIVSDENIEKLISEDIMELQKNFLDMFYIKVSNSKTKSEIIELIYEFRYYCMLPYKGHIYNSKNLKTRINKVSELLIQKAVENKIWIKICNDVSLYGKILREIFNTRIIALENIFVEMCIKDEKIYLNIMDEKNLEKEIEIKSKLNNDEFLIKLNKSVKLFI